MHHSNKNCPAFFVPGGLLDELLNEFSYPGRARPTDFIRRNPSCCSFHTPGSFLPPWYSPLKMTASLSAKNSKKWFCIDQSHIEKYY